MKKLLLFFFVALTLNADTGRQFDTVTQFVESAKKQAILESMKEEILQKDFIPVETEITPENSAHVLAPFTVSSKCETYEDLTCPAPVKGAKFFVRRHKADLKTGKVNCLVYGLDNIDRAGSNFTYTNPTCKARYTPDISSVQTSSYLQNLAQKSAQETELLNQEKSKAASRANALTDQQLNLSDLMVAVMTMDGSKIDLAQSIASGKMKINAGYTALIENTNPNSKAALSDLAAEALNSKTVAIFEFMSSMSPIIDLTLFMLILCFILAYLLKSGILVRVLFKKEREDGASNMAVSTVMIIGGIMFFLIPAVSLSINSDQYFSQSKFHVIAQSFFSQASKLSNTVNLFVHDATFSALLKERGYKSKEMIYQTAAEQKVLEQIATKSKSELDKCFQTFDLQKIKSYNGTFGKFSFPLTEEELHKSWTLSLPTAATSPYFDLLTNSDNVSKIGMTLSYCGQVERTYRETQLRLNQNLEYLSKGNTESDIAKREHVLKVVQSQYKAISDWGWLSAAFLPAALAELELELIDEAQKVTNEKSFMDEITFNLPYLMFPGTGTIITTMKDMTTIDIPILSTITKIIGAGAGAYTAIMLVKIILIIAPLLIMTIVSLVVGIILFYQIIAYVISGFYAILLAIWQNNSDNVFTFLGRGIRLFAKIVAFPISVFFGLQAHWTTTSIGGYLSSRFADNVGSNDLVSHFGFQIFGGVLNISIILVSIFLSFKIVGKFVDMILENLNFSKPDTLEQTTEQITQAAARTAGKKV